MIKKGEVVSFGIFMIAGLFVGSLLSGGIYELPETLKGPFVHPETGDPDPTRSGSMLVEVQGRLLGPDGTPVRILSYPLKFITREDRFEVEVEKFEMMVTKVVVTGEGFDYGDLYVKVYCKFDHPGGKETVKQTTFQWEPKGESDFAFTGDTKDWTATSKSTWTVTDTLIDRAKKHKLSYKQAYNWNYRAKAQAYCGGLEASDEQPLNFTTTWDEPNQDLDVKISAWGSGGRSFFPSDMLGLSITFVVTVGFIGIWYKWGRKLVTWT